MEHPILLFVAIVLWILNNYYESHKKEGADWEDKG